MPRIFILPTAKGVLVSDEGIVDANIHTSLINDEGREVRARWDPGMHVTGTHRSRCPVM